MISSRLRVEDGQYWIADDDPGATFALPDPGGSNGLVGVVPGLAVVVTGTQFGDLGVSVQLGDREPELDISGWDEVVEVSFACGQAGHGLGITSGGMGPDELQALTPAGAGTYRIRAHVRGRDAGADADVVEGKPIEVHLLQIWPAPTATEVIHKVTDRYGQALRDAVTQGPDPRYPRGEHAELAASQVIAETSRATAVFQGVDVHANGCRFKFRIVVDVSGLAPRLEKRARRAVDGHEGAALPESTSSGRLRAVVHQSGGHTADSQTPRDLTPRAGPGISLSYSSNYPLGESQVAEESFWAWPLPPPEPFTLTLEWPAVCIPPTTVAIDGAAIRAAARSLR
jgi:hypothetical protein